MRKIQQRSLELLRHPFLSGSTVLMMFGMCVNVISYLYHLLMGRALGPEKYGELASLYSVLYIVSVLPLSSGVSIVKFISAAKTKRDLAAVYQGEKRFLTNIAIAGAIVMIFLTPFIASFLRINDFLNILLLAPVLFFSLITLVNQAALQGILKFFGASVPSFTSAVVKLLIGTPLVLIGFSVRGAMLGVFAGAVAAYLISLKYLDGYFNLKTSGKFNLKSFISYSTPVVLQSIAFTLIFTMDVILVKHFFSSYEAGIYSALSTLGKIVFFAASPIASAMFPFVSTRKSRGEKYLKIVLSSLGITTVIILMALGVFYFLPDLAIGILYGRDYLSAKGDLVWMGLFIGFYTISSLLINFFLAIDRTKIVILPLVMSFAQIILIWLIHSSLLVVIQISLSLMIVQFLILALYLGYVKLHYEKAK